LAGQRFEIAGEDFVQGCGPNREPLVKCVHPIALSGRAARPNAIILLPPNPMSPPTRRRQSGVLRRASCNALPQRKPTQPRLPIVKATAPAPCPLRAVDERKSAVKIARISSANQ
jgi:hypothetical protein